jgi:hypothetical protein
MNRLLATSLACSVSLSLAFMQADSAHAQFASDQTTATQTTDANDVVNRVLTANFSPSNSGVPGGTAGGGSRGGGACPTDSVNYGASLTPLLAANAQNLTTHGQPTFLVYIDNTAVAQLFLRVSDSEGSYDYQTLLPISEESGILKISLPDHAPALSVGSTYQWSLAMICGESLRPDDPFIQGTIQRIDPLTDLQSSEMEQVAQFAEQGIWYDAMSTLADLRYANPDNTDMQSAWVSLLNHVGLEELATEPLLF